MKNKTFLGWNVFFIMFTIFINKIENMKQKIRLTEEDLHRIVKESVMKVLSEAVDPRSWDAVARRYDQTDPQKAAYARQRAATAFNNKYGYDTNNNYVRKSYRMNVGNKEYPYKASSYYEETDNPRGAHGQTHFFGNNGNDKVNHRDGSMGQNYREYTDSEPFYQYNHQGREQAKIARQMAQGNGVYEKSKGGWQ